MTIRDADNAPPPSPLEGGFGLSSPLYWFYEMTHVALNPSRAMAHAAHAFFKSPSNPASNTSLGKSISAACELFERATRRYSQPEWDIEHTVVDGKFAPVSIETVWERPFCRMLHFDRQVGIMHKPDPRVLLIAPLSGHYATLLRGTVEALLPEHDVYITDWIDARMVPMSDGRFDLDDYIDYIIGMLRLLGSDTHVMAVCQPGVPALCAISVMEANEETHVPESLTLMGSPIDTRISPTQVNQVAEKRGIDWFRRNVITKVPFPNPGFMRDVYPGFLQLNGFMSMNLDRHMEAHSKLFQHLVEGDGDSATAHRDFYDEYLAVMDLTAEFYLQTIDAVFIRHALPDGKFIHRGIKVDPSKIKRVALMTIEGEQDDITGLGQTQAAQTLCVNIPEHKKVHYVQPGVGHYGVFNGSRFRNEILPRITAFIRAND
ncbi:MAG: polyhydroxyalkanoate depolymerase [Rhodoplanes sp.]|uniref:polyhydroxyalkanoate depolymerase n=1 Tax=Rhodoplanes sp. TaxID=1968906 RepID=UPI0017AB9CF6|nr:polyhydroxyalkanoate depolymerase [Rhodoplanes sp.]NVO14892.1 polyhydroxyalkanoate depolymerase [Rhodoplanes sp.]